MQINVVKEYLDSKDNMPFFLFVSDSQYHNTLDDLLAAGLTVVKMSEFSSGEDKMPDTDRLSELIKFSDINIKDKKLVVIGLGEYLALRGNSEMTRVISELKHLNTGGAKVILLLRGISSQIKNLIADPRFDNRRYSVIDKADCNISITLADLSIGLSALSGFKALLEELENGQHGNIVVNTDVNLDCALFNVHTISSAYDGIKFASRGFTLPCSCGSDNQWAELLSELNQNNDSLDDVFEKKSLNSKLGSDFFTCIAGNDYHNWLYFIYLKYKVNTLDNSYLRFVLEKTNRFEDFKSNILNTIIEISHTDKRFTSFYLERKSLIQKFPEPDIADFVINNRIDKSESIFKLTDSTKPEREEIIAWIAENGPFSKIEDIYPALAAYNKNYIFKCPDLSDLFTEYFDAYKRQKLLNTLESEFLAKIDEYAISRKYTCLPTRNEILENLDKTDTILYWLDTLGVEYLAFIESLAQRNGLSITINIARAELPTITSINRDFYDAWQGDKYPPDKELDEIKHKEKGGYNFADNNLPNRNDLPIHLAKELDVINSVINKAATDLSSRHYKRFLIVSDHGASRLAVLRRKEEKYETGTKSKYSGRCCELFQPYDLPFATEENGHLILADYGRFKGSRAANVEVHGGASLEEVVVPIIELSLKDGSITVKLINEIVISDSRSGSEIDLFINSSVHNVYVILNEKRYSASQIDTNHYTVKLPDIKKVGNYPVKVYAGDDLIDTVTVKVQGKSGKVDADFDDLFKERIND